MLLDRLDKHLDARNLHLAEPDCQRLARFAGDAARAAIGDFPGGVERTEVAADRHIVRAEFKTDARGFQRPAANDILERIVTEQAKADRDRSPACDARLGPEWSRPSVPRPVSSAEIRREGRSDSVSPPGCIGKPPGKPIGDEHGWFLNCSFGAARG